MSYLPDFIPEHNEASTEIHPGVFLERRHFLKISAGALCAFLLQNTLLRSQEKTTQNDTDNYDLKKFIEELTPKANKILSEENRDEDLYLKEIIEMIKKVKNLEHSVKTNKKIHFTPMHNVAPIKIYQIRMLPHAVLPCHDHRDYNGIIQVLDGSANIRNFDFEGKSDNFQNEASFKVKETKNFDANQGDISSLSTSRDNIHEIIAGKNGVLFLDVFTFFKNTGTSKYLILSKNPVDEKERIFDATWKK